MDEAHAPLPAVDALPLIEEVDDALVALLRGLDREDWHRVANRAWTVKHVAAHLLDGNLRRLSLDRDGWVGAATPRESHYQALVDFLNQLNADWIRAMDRISPRVVVDLLAVTNREVRSHFRTLDPNAAARFPVAWAGQDASVVWMDVAREYTEKWHHQQQIRDAVQRPGLKEHRYLQPLLATFARVLPRSYATSSARTGTTIVITVTDVESSTWLLRREADRWGLYDGSHAGSPTAEVRTSGDIAWRLFTKGLDAKTARASSQCSGPGELIDPFFGSVAIMG